ncbi:hypothetical protein Tco_0488140 [Tanacetum coccineum]
MITKEKFAADTKKAMKASKQANREVTRTLQQSGGSSEGAGVTPNGSKEESDKSNENVDDIPWVSISDEEEKGDDDDDRSIDIEETDGERLDSNNGDQAMIDMEKNVAEKTEEEQGDEEQAEEAQYNDDQDQKDQANDDIIGTLVTMLQKQKPEVPRSSSSRSLSSNYDVQIQQEIPSVLSALLLDVPVFVIPLQTTTTSTPLTTSLTTPIPTPPIISTATTTTPTTPNLLPEVIQRVFALEKEVKELKQVDHSIIALASVRSHVPSVMNECLGSTLGDTHQKVLRKHTKELIQQFPQTSAFEIIKVKQEQAAKDKFPKFSSTPYDQQADEEHKQKDILFIMMISSNSLVVDTASQRKRRHEDKDEDPSDGSDQGEKKRKQGDKSESLKKSFTSKESSKGKTPPKTSKTIKSVHAEETVKEATHEVAMDVEEPNQEDAENNAHQPQSKDASKTSKIPSKYWFKQPLRPPTPDPEWNTV